MREEAGWAVVAWGWGRKGGGGGDRS
jgi:hypothetical protein